MAKQKNAAELRVENRLLRRVHSASALASVVNNLIRWGGTVWIVYWVFRMVESVAGEQTGANIVIQFLANVTVSQSLAYLLGAGGVTYGVVQKIHRKKTTEHLHGRIKKLEQSTDPRRTSSQLTKQGETNPKDRE